MRPSTTPLLHSTCSRISTPGMPFGTQRNDVRAFGLFLPLRAFVIERAVVGREGLKHAAGNALPDRIPARVVARRRRADVFAAALVHVQAFEIVGRQRDVLRAGLAVDLQPALLRPADLLHRLAAGHVHDHDRHVESARHG